MPFDPRTQPPFPQPTISTSGRNRDIQPKPDHGETSHMMGSGTTPFQLDGSVAVVTGAARGIGRAAAMALALALAEADVAGIDIAGPTGAVLDFAPASNDGSSG